MTLIFFIPILIKKAKKKKKLKWKLFALMTRELPSLIYLNNFFRLNY